MPRFTYNDIVVLKRTGVKNVRAGERASVIAVLDDRTHFPLRQFSPGVIYSVEFEDGVAVQVHEDDLEPEN